MKSLLWVCTALEAKRRNQAGKNSAHQLSEFFTPELERLMEMEDFKRLELAKSSIKNGYYSFLSHLSLICFWLYREAGDASHVVDMNDKEIAKVESKHRKEIARLEKEISDTFSKEEFQETKSRWEEDEKSRLPRIRRTRNATDLPTLGMIQTVHRQIFPAEARKFWKPHPNDLSAIWQDAGLAWVPQDRDGVGGANHPSIGDKCESLKAFLRSLSEP
jgi:hypothetical protein